LRKGPTRRSSPRSDTPLSPSSRHGVFSVASRSMSQQETDTFAAPMTGGDEQRVAAERYRLVIESMGP